jgi:hypothetical protein
VRSYTLHTYALDLTPYRGGLWRIPDPHPEAWHPDVEWKQIVRWHRRVFIGHWCHQQNFAWWSKKDCSCNVWVVTDEWLCDQMWTAYGFQLVSRTPWIQAARWTRVRQGNPLLARAQGSHYSEKISDEVHLGDTLVFERDH